jgi:hypothetical protein
MVRYHGYDMRALAAREVNQPAGQGMLMELPESVRQKPEMKKRGHAAFPGSGPDGETCGSCRHYRTHRVGAYRKGKTFPKCSLMRERWTAGKGSDIRKKDPACAKWEKPGD